jgi:hypothetical protein
LLKAEQKKPTSCRRFPIKSTERCGRYNGRAIADRAFSGKVETSFPSENATNAKKPEHVQFLLKLNMR